MNIADRISIRLASRKQPVASVVLSQRNIYIFPSKAGLAFILLLCLMLLTAINYQSSLVYLFTFFLGALFFVSIWLCFLNVSGLVVSSGAASSCFAGEDVPYEITLRKEASAAMALKLVLKESAAFTGELKQGSTEVHTLLDTPKSRGVYQLERVYLHSYFPFGLIRAWTWLRLDAKAYVFPKPVNGSDVKTGTSSTDQSHHLHESDELSDLKPYQQGESTNRVIWKRYAARDELVTRQREMAALDSSWVRWDDYDTANHELKLSYMSYDVLQSFGQHARFGLELPGRVIPPSSGEAHKIKCLRALAEF